MTRRALLLAAALAWPGVAWGQTGSSAGCAAGSSFDWRVGACLLDSAHDKTTPEYIRPAIPTRACPAGQSCSAGRSYTPAEIDRMRAAVGRMPPNVRSLSADGHGIILELRLQTYIAAGITAEELEKQ